jgi:hypothetical protein
MDNQKKIKSTNFSFSIDASQVDVSDKPRTKIAPKGAYKGILKEIYVDPSFNKDLVNFTLEVSEGVEKGNIMWGSMFMPGTTQKDNTFFWVKFFLSMGASLEQVKSSVIQFRPTDYIGRMVHVFYSPKNLDIGEKYHNVRFLSPSQWEQRKTEWDAEKNSALASSTPVTAVKAISAIPAIPALPTPTSTVTIPQAVPSAGFAQDNKSGNDILNFLNPPN